MVVASGIVAVGTKETLLCLAGEGDAEVIAHGVDGSTHILHLPMAGAVLRGLEEIQPAHAWMTVGSEIEGDGVSAIGEQLVARRIDRLTQVLHRSEAVIAQYFGTENVFSSKTSDRIRHIIEVLPIG